MSDRPAPGVRLTMKDQLTAPAVRTGVPAFLGFAPQDQKPEESSKPLARWEHFVSRYGYCQGYPLADAVQGFFTNGGTICYVMLLDPTQEPKAALEAGLAALEDDETVDLICTPDIHTPELQQMVLEHCDRLGERFAILSCGRHDTAETVKATRTSLHGTHGAFYFPWIKLADGRPAPPDGHIAGIYARSDRRYGVHKAPANEILEGVVDLAANLSTAEQGELNALGINCIRAFPGHGIRIWGAHTLSSKEEPEWRYVNVRRLFLTVQRQMRRLLEPYVFEPNDPALWARITRELTVYCNALYQTGALQGATAQEAYFVKCDVETNPPEERNAGRTIARVGLAPSKPAEFIEVEITRHQEGVAVELPA